MRAPESIAFKTSVQGSSPATVLQGGHYQLSGVSSGWNGAVLSVDQLLPSGYFGPPSNGVAGADLATAIAGDPVVTTVAANVGTLVSDGASPTQAHVTTLSGNWASLKTVVDAWLVLVGTFKTDFAAWVLTTKGFGVSTTTVEGNVTGIALPSYTAFAAALAVLVADGATPTQTHVGTANSAYGTLATAISTLHTLLGTISTNFNIAVAAIVALNFGMALTASGVTDGYLPPGDYRLSVGSGTPSAALSAALVSIPGE